MNNKIRLFTIITMSSLVLMAIPAGMHAHDMWFEMKKFDFQKGSRIQCVFPSDHAFPSSQKEFVPHDRLSASYIILPDGTTARIVPSGVNEYASAVPLSRTGTYLAVSGKKWTYWVKTTEGTIEGKNKAQVKGAIKGMYSGKFAKAIITAESPGGRAFSRVVGHDLEIVPLKDPGTLTKGDVMPVRLLLHGRPAAIEVKATYDGYSSRKNVFAVTGKSDTQGLYDLKLSKKGKWLIRISHNENTPGNRLCDVKMYAATLTFEIR